MSTKEIIQEIERLPFSVRFRVIEKALKTLHESTDTQMKKAADALLSDYKKDSDLTAFTALDCEEFYETR